jgi:hypothetical protein
MRMSNFFMDYFGETMGPIIGLGLLLLIAGLVAWLIWIAFRRTSSGLFVSRQKGRAPRLAVTDAVPVDSHRRLVLVRRDDVEHLIMIGGPTDIVIEGGIGKGAPAARTAAEAARDAVEEAERGRPVRQPPQPSAEPAAKSAVAATNAPSAAATVPPAAPVTPPAPVNPAATTTALPSAPAATPRPHVAPPVFPEALNNPPAQEPAAAPASTAVHVGGRAEPTFAPNDAASAASKASAELDRILAEIELSRAPTR